jgi:hypothetical protein
MQPDVLVQLTQFGVAGLIAWMWLSERRGAMGRERQLSAAHDRILEQRVQLDALMSLVSENTRAVTALESAQRSLNLVLERLVSGGRAGPRGGGPAPAG